MRKLLILPFILAVLMYAAWPVWSALQLRAAVKARDLTGIEWRVNWPTLRSNLKQTIAGRLKDESPDKGVVGTLKRALGPFVAGQMVDFAVTPGTLGLVLAGLEAKSVAPVAAASGEVDAIDDQLAPRRLRWAFFETPSRFRIEVTALTDPTKRVVSVLALQGASWKLVDVYYHTP